VTLKVFEATIETDGSVQLRNSVQLPHRCRAIVTVIEDSESSETALLSEAALAEDWNRPEEDEAWAHLQPVP